MSRDKTMDGEKLREAAAAGFPSAFLLFCTLLFVYLGDLALVKSILKQQKSKIVDAADEAKPKTPFQLASFYDFSRME